MCTRLVHLCGSVYSCTQLNSVCIAVSNSTFLMLTSSQGKYLRGGKVGGELSSQDSTSLALDSTVMVEEEDGMLVAGGKQDVTQLEDNSRILFDSASTLPSSGSRKPRKTNRAFAT